MKKKLLVALLISTMFSAGISGQDLGFVSDQFQSYQSQVTYRQGSQYEILIPQDIPANGMATVQMSYLDLCPGEYIEVSLDGIADDGTLNLHEYSKKRDMTATVQRNDGSLLKSGDVLCTFTEDNKYPDSTFFITPKEVPGAGYYMGTITFNVEIK